MGKWRTELATECGHEVPVHEEWENIPRFCPECKEERASAWSTAYATECGHEVPMHRDWDHVPRFCKTCKKENDEKWYDGVASVCGHVVRINRDWDREPALCKSCKDMYPPIEKTCIDCYDNFTFTSVSQYKFAQQGYTIPERCPECRENRRLYMGALGALREEVPYGICMEIEASSVLGFVLNSVAVVRGKRDGNVVAEIGIVHDVFGKKIAETRMVEGVGLLGGRKLGRVRAETTSEDTTLGGRHSRTETRGPEGKRRFETRKVNPLLGGNSRYDTSRDGKVVTSVNPTREGGSAHKRKKW